jgi:hypothetical protein
MFEKHPSRDKTNPSFKTAEERWVYESFVMGPKQVFQGT